MSKYILYFSTLLLLSSCTNTIGYLPDDEPQKLIVNALLSTDSSRNAVYLHYSQYSQTLPVADGKIRIFVNEALKEEVTAQDHEQPIYPIRTPFHTGDKVRIEASAGNGSYRAEAETKVPPALQIAQVDTSYVYLRNYNVWANNQPSYDKYLRISIQLKENHVQQASPQYYRLEVEQVYYGYKEQEDGQAFLPTDTLNLGTRFQYQYIYDTALTDGKPGKFENEGISIIQPLENFFGLFKNSYFHQGTYTMNIELGENHYFKDYQGRIDRDVTLRVYSISENEFRYLHSIGAVLQYDPENFIYPIPIIPNNLSGGIGIFSIANVSTYSFKEENCHP